jgi:hypothetical protein
MFNKLLSKTLLAASFYAGACVAQNIPESKFSSPHIDEKVIADLQNIGRKTVAAILRRDITTLSSIVDKDGITLGTDGEKISANTFRNQLKRRDGLYCDLFGCRQNESNLESWMHNEMPKIKIQNYRDFSNTGYVDVFDNNDIDDQKIIQRPLFTLGFIFRKEKWYLFLIEYI